MRSELVIEVLADQRTVESSAAVMWLAWRQTFRLLPRYEGGTLVIHKARRRASDRQMHLGARKCPVVLVRTRCSHFGPTLAAEVLLEKHFIIEAGNAFLPVFVSRFNERFAARPAKPTT